MVTTFTEERPPMTPDDAAADEVLQQMLAMAQSAVEPSSLRKGDVVHDGIGEVPNPMVAGHQSSAGYVYVYDTRTGDRSLCQRNMLPAQLKKRHPKLAGQQWQGRQAFTTLPPEQWLNNRAHQSLPPRQVSKAQTLKCLLHPDQPEREHYDAMGLDVCTKHNIPNQFQLEQHMLRKHKGQWNVIDRERQERERAETLALQRAILEQAARGAGLSLPETPFRDVGSSVTTGSAGSVVVSGDLTPTRTELAMAAELAATATLPTVPRKPTGRPKGKPRPKAMGRGNGERESKGARQAAEQNANEER